MFHRPTGRRSRRFDRIKRASTATLLILLTFGYGHLSADSNLSHQLGPNRPAVYSAPSSVSLWIGTTNSSNYPDITNYTSATTSTGALSWTSAGSITLDYNSNTGLIKDLAISGDGKTAIVTQYNNSAGSIAFNASLSAGTSSVLLDEQTGGQLSKFEGASLSPSGKWGYFTDGNAALDSLGGAYGDGLEVYNMSSGSRVAGYVSGTDTDGVVACPDGTYVATLDKSGDLNVFTVNPSTGALTSYDSTTFSGTSSNAYLTCVNGTIQAQSGGDAASYDIASKTISYSAPPSGVTLTAVDTESIQGSNLCFTDGSNDVWAFEGSGFSEVMSASAAPSSVVAVAGGPALGVLGTSHFVANSASTSVANSNGSGNNPVAIAYGVTPQTGPGASKWEMLAQQGENEAIDAMSCFTCGESQDATELADEAELEGSTEVSDELGADEEMAVETALPVNTETGNFNYSLPSIKLDGLGPTVGVTPTYNSLNASNLGSSQGLQDFGYGFSAGPGVGVLPNTPSTGDYTVVTQQGNQFEFVPYTTSCPTNTTRLDASDYLGAGTPYCVNTNVQAEFYVSSSSNTYTFLSLNPYEVYTFCNSSSGCTANSDNYACNELESIQDRNGEQVTVAYTGGAKECPYATIPTSVVYTAASGRTLTENLNGSGQVTSATDGVREWSFTYDTATSTCATSTPATCKAGDMATATLSAPAPTTTVGSAPGGPSSYEWQFAYDETSNLNAMSTVTDPRSNTELTNTYDDTSSSDTYFGYTLTQTDALSREWKFAYTGIDPSTMTGSVMTTDPIGNETLLAYANSALVSETKGYGTATSSTKIWNRDTATSRSTDYMDPSGKISTIGVDAFGRITSFTDPAGNETLTTYVVSATGVSSALDLKEFSEISTQSSAIKSLESSPAAPREMIVDAYDTNGNPACSIRDTDPTISAKTPSADDTLSSCTDGDSDSGGTAEPVTSTTTCHTSGGCSANGNTYKEGELESTTDANGNTTVYAYNSYGDTTSSTDALSDETTYSYCTTGSGCTTTLGNVTYTYYSGALQSSVSPDGNVSGCGCASTYTTKYAYSANGKPIETEGPQVNGVSGIKWNTYDPNGNLTISVDDVDGSSDLSTNANESTGDDDASTDYGSGSAGSTTNPEAITTYEYDSANQLCWSTMQSVSSPSCSTIPTGDQTKAYTYDKDGRMTSAVNADGIATDYSYDSLGRLAAQLTDPDDDLSSELDSNGNLTDADSAYDQTGATEVLTTYTYDPNSNVVKAVTSTGTTNVFAYDPNNYPTVATYGDPGGSASLSSIGCGSSTFCVTGGADQGGSPLLLNSGSPFTKDSLAESAVSVSCFSTSACTSVGQSGDYSSAAYSTSPGTSWSAATTIPSSTLSLAGVSCASASDCWAVGQDPYADVVDTTNGGSTWSSQSSNVPGEAGQLTSISCIPNGTQSTTNCLAVGTATIGSGAVLSLATTNGGSTWSDQGILSGITELSSVTCTSTSDCWVVRCGPGRKPAHLLHDHLRDELDPDDGALWGYVAQYRLLHGERRQYKLRGDRRRDDDFGLRRDHEGMCRRPLLERG